jgi:hypothetical protein
MIHFLTDIQKRYEVRSFGDEANIGQDITQV